MMYRVVGDIPAPTFFDVNPTTGALFVKENLKLDNQLEYMVCAFIIAGASITVNILLQLAKLPWICISKK